MTVREIVRRSLSTLGRFYPLPSGQHRLGCTRIVLWACDGVTLAEAGRKGVDLIYTDLTDADGRSPHLFGFNDGKIRDILRRLVRPNDTVLDIGASYGGFSILAARLVGPRGRVHAFEPQCRQAGLLQRSASANGFSQLSVHPVALSDTEGTFPMYVSGPNTGLTSFTHPGPGHPRSVIQVRAVRGDDYFRDLGLAPVRLIKIDAEKHEDPIFRGARVFLERFPPDYILFEYCEPAHHFWQSPLVRRLQTLGYDRLFEVPRRLLCTRARLMRPDIEPHVLSENFVAQHEKLKESLLPL